MRVSLYQTLWVSKASSYLDKGANYLQFQEPNSNVSKVTAQSASILEEQKDSEAYVASPAPPREAINPISSYLTPKQQEFLKALTSK